MMPITIGRIVGVPRFMVIGIVPIITIRTGDRVVGIISVTAITFVIKHQPIIDDPAYQGVLLLIGCSVYRRYCWCLI